MNQVRHAVARVIDMWAATWIEHCRLGYGPRATKVGFALFEAPVLAVMTPFVFAKAAIWERA